MDLQNQLRMAREAEKSPQEQVIEMAKKQVKKKLLILFCVKILPILLIILAIIAMAVMIWYMGCFNPNGTIKGWFISKFMQAKGWCPK